MYQWVEHMAELELQIEAPSEPAVFAEALAAFAELAGDEDGGEAVRHDVELEADDRAALLVDWLNELVYLADVEQFVPEALVELELDDGRLRASVSGHRGQPRPLVKAVTHHGLAFGRTDSSTWRARVVLDV